MSVEDIPHTFFKLNLIKKENYEKKYLLLQKYLTKLPNYSVSFLFID